MPWRKWKSRYLILGDVGILIWMAFDKWQLSSNLKNLKMMMEPACRYLGESSLDLGSSGYRGPVVGACLAGWVSRREVHVADQSKWVRMVSHRHESVRVRLRRTFWITVRTSALILSKTGSVKRFWPKSDMTCFKAFWRICFDGFVGIG